ncbi:MAG: hypothetical protein R2684_08315 [Pyrinomonadaceae bacterium]
MSRDLEISFNSPQCGWMSVGFKSADSEFNTTTAHAPYKNALSEILSAAAAFASGEDFSELTVLWNRDPEEYEFNFESLDGVGSIEIVEYADSEKNDGETVFSYSGNARSIASAFEATFAQMYDERDVDEFTENWHQGFPKEGLEELRRALA